MESSHSAQSPTGGVAMRRTSTQPALHDRLMERVLDRFNMRSAWEQVKANRGAPGVDGMTVDEFPAFAREYWPAIREALLEGSYSPQPVRRVEIPKPSGGGEPASLGT